MLKGLEKTISHNPNLKLIVEVHSDEIREECLSILQEKGYAVREISDRHLFAIPVVH